MATAEAEVDLRPRILMLTDIVDSTKTFGALGEAAAARLWAEHDTAARDLLGQCAGTEIERGDGFLLVFDAVADAARFAAGYHALLGRLSTPLATRIGIHAGLLRVRANTPDHVSQGARMLDLDGQAKATVARIQSLAQAGQTLASAPAVEAWPDTDSPRRSHGYWRLKGLADPLELFEIGPDAARFAPPPDAEKVWRVVLQGDLWLPAREVPHTLPAERDRFVGRGEHAARAALAIEQSRLVSLLGIGGTGKTRLALRLGWQRLGDHPGGVWFCDLSAAVTPDGIVHATAQGLQLPLGAADPVQQVGDAIAGRGDCLVILDNFEQVARHAEATLGRWLQRAPQARFLVTSREVLGIVGEQALALPPLPQDEGEALLRERAAQAGAPEFEPEDEQAVPELVRLLDGLPLAIELAASRMRVMGPADMLPRMNQRFKLLASRGGRPDRQATLRATLDWSWELLSEPERSALAQLSVFEGGFTLEAAQAVVDLSEFAGSDADDDAHADLWVVDVVQALVDKSLVRRVGERRFDLLRSVQEYASERMSAIVSDSRNVKAVARHINHFSTMRAADLEGAGRTEIENLMAACQRPADDVRLETRVQLLESVWVVLGRIGPVRAALGPALQILEGCRGGPAALRATVLRIVGSILYRQGDSAAAIASLREGLGLVQGGDKPETEFKLHCALVEPLMRSGRRDDALSHLNAAKIVAAELKAPELQYLLHNTAGHFHLECGKLDLALRCYECALVTAATTGLRRLRAGVLGNIGAVHYLADKLDQAIDSLEGALTMVSELDDRRWEANTRGNLGLALLDLGLHAKALAHLDSALSIARQLGARRQECALMCNLGIARTMLGDHMEALQCYMGSRAISLSIDDNALIAEAEVRAGASELHLGAQANASIMIDSAHSRYLLLEDWSGLAICSYLKALSARNAGHLEDGARHQAAVQMYWHDRAGLTDAQLHRRLRTMGIDMALPASG